MKLKICGMRERENLGKLISLDPDFVGFIFYKKSARYIGEKPEELHVPPAIKRVGVFVNPAEEEVLEKVSDFKLDLVQLHGDESVDFVERLKGQGLKVMKVFSVMDELPLEEMRLYEPYVDFFLFDTKTPAYGGSGKKFDWSVLHQYNLRRPFFLSGGIGLEDIEAVKKLSIDKLYAIDVNSRFETAPGIKDIEKIKKLKNKMSDGFNRSDGLIRTHE